MDFARNPGQLASIGKGRSPAVPTGDGTRRGSLIGIPAPFLPDRSHNLDHQIPKPYPMKTRNLVLALALAAGAQAAQAQISFNPQVGANFTQLTNMPSGMVSSAAVGWQVGADFRLGERFYFQPGAYFGRSATYIKFTPLDTVFIEDNMIRTTAKVKALVGYNIIHDDNFKLRVNAGPTYEALLSIDSKDDKIAFNKKDYNGGSFNLDAGLGVDIWKISLETGVSYGLSNAYKDSGKFMQDAKYFTWYATVGLVLFN